MATGELAHSDESAPAGQPAESAERASSVERRTHSSHGELDGNFEDADEELPPGSVRTASGRISAALDTNREPGVRLPFSPVQLSRLDEALTLVSRHTQLRFSVYLGELGENTHTGAERLHDHLGAAAADSVLIALDVARRQVDIVTGSVARLRLPDRGCKLAVMSMVASFREGDLIGGLLSGLRMLSDQAGRP
jgi:hypothetical protein